MNDLMDWTTALPPQWKTKPLKAVANYTVSNVDKVPDKNECPVRLCNYTDVYKNEFISLSLDFMQSTATPLEIEKFRLNENDVVITKDSESWDDIAVPALVAETADDLVCGYHLAVLRPTDGQLLGRFLFRCLQAKVIRLQLELASTGVTRFGLPKDEIGRLVLPIPPLDTQRRIASYLDLETVQIDTLIAEKEHMLALLAEKRAALVSRAVTRGLDPDAPMKLSGLEWLGEIPAHWKVKRAKWMFREIDIRSTTGEEILLSLRMTRGLVPHDEVSEKPIPSKDLIGYKLVQPNEIVINRMRAASGLIAISPQAGIVSPDYAVFHTLVGVLPDYYTILFKTTLLQSLFRSYSTGLGTGSSGFLRLYSDDFLALWFPAPTIAEQQAIVDFLAQDQAKTAHMEAELLLSLSLLKERRSALITAAVTGQLDLEVMAA